MGGSVEWPGPPDLPREIHKGRSTAVDFALGYGDAHFAKQVRGWKIEKSLRARVLQGGQAEAARFEWTLKAASQASTNAALAVEENPATGSPTSFRISYF